MLLRNFLSTYYIPRVPSSLGKLLASADLLAPVAQQIEQCANRLLVEILGSI